MLGTGGKVLSAAARNPKTTAVTGVASFAGWRMLDHPEESLGTAVGKTVRGGVDGTGDFLHDAVNGFTGEQTVEQVKDTASNVVSDLKETVAESKNVLGSLGDTLQGIGSTLGSLLGSGVSMITNLFSNLSNSKFAAGKRMVLRSLLVKRKKREKMSVLFREISYLCCVKEEVDRLRQ